MAIACEDTMSEEAEATTESWRLPQPRLRALRDVARGVEETNAGVCTRYIVDGPEDAVVRALAPPDDDEGYVELHDVERFVDRFGRCPWRTGIKRCRRALALMREKGQHRHVDVLHVAYGYPDPSTAGWPAAVSQHVDPDLASLLRYTDATEERRVEIVKRLARARDPGPWTEFACRNLDSAGGELEAAVRGVAELNLFERRRLLEPVDLRSHRERLAYHDRVVSSGDAVAEIVASFPEPRPRRAEGEDKRDHAERCRPWEERRDEHVARQRSWIVEARAEADDMLTRASRAYNDAWLASR